MASSTAHPELADLALAALGWILADGERADRFLALTGLTPEALRAGVGDPSTHRAIVEYLCGYEADLVACADMLNIPPARFSAALAGPRS